jgi:hypothetical protein
MASMAKNCFPAESMPCLKGILSTFIKNCNKGYISQKPTKDEEKVITGFS